MQTVINRILLCQATVALVTTLLLTLKLGWLPGLACSMASVAVLVGAGVARHRAFLARPCDGSIEVLKAFNRAMVLKWLVTLLLFFVAVMLFSSEPVALAIGFTVTILSAIPAGMMFTPK